MLSRARRRLDNGMLYWRVNQFVMPFYSLVPPQSKFPDLSGHAWVLFLSSDGAAAGPDSGSFP